MGKVVNHCMGHLDGLLQGSLALSGVDVVHAAARHAVGRCYNRLEDVHAMGGVVVNIIRVVVLERESAASINRWSLPRLLKRAAHVPCVVTASRRVLWDGQDRKGLEKADGRLQESQAELYGILAVSKLPITTYLSRAI